MANQMASRQSSACFFFSLMIEYYCYGNGPSPSGKAQDFDSCTRGFESRWPSEKRLNFYYGNSAFFIFIEFIFYFLNHLQNAFPTMFHCIRTYIQVFLRHLNTLISRISRCKIISVNDLRFHFHFTIKFHIYPFVKYKKAPGTASQGNTGGYRDSNPGPPEPQSGALTSCAIPTII